MRVFIDTNLWAWLRSIARRISEPPLRDRQISELLAAPAGFEEVGSDAT
jgi:hypothetical protein